VSIRRSDYLPQPVPGQAAAMWDPTRTLRTSDRTASRDVRLARTRELEISADTPLGESGLGVGVSARRRAYPPRSESRCFRATIMTVGALTMPRDSPMATSRTSAACSVESCFRCTGRFTLLPPLEPPVPNVGQLDRPQHGLDKPDSAVGEVVNEVGCFGPEVGDEDGCALPGVWFAAATAETWSWSSSRFEESCASTRARSGWSRRPAKPDWGQAATTRSSSGSFPARYSPTASFSRAPVGGFHSRTRVTSADAAASSLMRCSISAYGIPLGNTDVELNQELHGLLRRAVSPRTAGRHRCRMLPR
jgi:hypothetical protein